MSNAILSVFQSADLDIYEKSALILIRTLSTEHDSVFPSYETIAAMCGMSRRKAIYVIKRLVELGLITKESRGKKHASYHDKTNEYTAPYAPTADIVCAPDAHYGTSSYKPSTKNEEENNIKAPAHVYLPFEYEIEKHAVPTEIRAAILDYVKAAGSDIRDYSGKAIATAFKAAMGRLKRGVSFANLPKWIAVAIRNEAFKLSASKAAGTWTDALERAKAATAHLSVN